MERLRRHGPVVGLFIVFVLVWQLVVDVFHVSPFLLPSPTTVASTLWASITHEPFAHGNLGAATVDTFKAALLGFAVAAVLGVLMAAIMVWIPVLQHWFLPYVVGFQTLPRLAIAPLFIIWFGHGLQSKVILAALVAFFPVLINALAGFKSTDHLGIELLRSLRASRLQIFRYYQLPTSLPYIFAGLELALVFSLLGVIVAEFVGGTGGVGVLILQYHYTVDIAGVFSVLVVVAAVGLALRAILLAIRKRMLFWMPDPESGGGGA